MYGPVRTVVWQGSAGDRRPYADHRETGNVKERRPMYDQIRSDPLDVVREAEKSQNR